MDDTKPPQPNKGSRRSTKKKAKTLPVLNEDANASVQAAPKKRATGKGKGKAGKLEGLMIMPMDVLFEIFSHLRPLDILHLTRTTKEFRRVLMNKSHIFIWKAARANVLNYPACFPDMNEAQMARLAFDPHCYVCWGPNCRTVDWALRIRLCQKCLATNLVGIDRRNYSSEAERYMLLVCTRMTARDREVAFIEEVQAVKLHWTNLKSPEEREVYSNERRAFKLAVEEHVPRCINWYKNQQNDRSMELQQARDDRKASIVEKLEELGWGPEIEQIPDNPLEDMIGNHRLVRQPTRLTPRIWKNIQPEMTKYMERMKNNRLERERAAIIVSRKQPAVNVLRTYKKSQLPWTELMPEPIDFCQLAPVKAVLELPNEITVDESSFAEVIPLLPGLFADWRKNIEAQMLECLGRGAIDERDIYDDESPSPSAESPSKPSATELLHEIQLATTVFRCTACTGGQYLFDLLQDSMMDNYHRLYHHVDKSEPLFYPKVMSHQCLTRKTHYTTDRNDVSVYLEQTLLARQPLSCRRLEVNKAAESMMKAIVKFCELDPAAATVNDLDELDVWFGCPECPRWHGGPDHAEVSVFGWRAALKHQAETHRSKTIEWLSLSDVQKQEATTIPSTSSSMPIDEGSALDYLHERWSCTHCFDLPCENKPQPLTTVKEHLLTKHQVSDPQPDIDYYSSTGSTGQFASRASKATFDIKKPPRRLDFFDSLNPYRNRSLDYLDDEMEIAIEEHAYYCGCGNFLDHWDDDDDDDFF